MAYLTKTEFSVVNYQSNVGFPANENFLKKRKKPKIFVPSSQTFSQNLNFAKNELKNAKFCDNTFR